MKSIRYVPVAAAVAGVAGAVLRGMNLNTGYEWGTRLPVPQNFPQTLLIVLSVAVVIGLFLWTRPLRARSGTDFMEVFGCSGNVSYKSLAVILAMVMGGAGILGIYRFVTVPATTLYTSLSLIPLWMLTIASMFSFVIIASAQARGNISESYAIFTIIPMFWACFDLIITFQSNASSPFVSLYAFELFAAIGLMFAYYSFAGFLYSTGNPARFVFSAALAVFFCFTCVGGYLAASVFGGTPVTLNAESALRYACFLAGALFLLANVWISTRHLCYAQKH